MLLVYPILATFFLIARPHLYIAAVDGAGRVVGPVAGLLPVFATFFPIVQSHLYITVVDGAGDVVAGL